MKTNSLDSERNKLLERLRDVPVKVILKDGEPCQHHGCWAHVTHPCEGCGRIGARGITTIELIKMVIL